MKKSHKIIYWIATVWLSLGMLSTGIIQIIKLEEETEMMGRLGYPLYFLTIIGVWKILGVAAILLPKLPLFKEWAYAGFFFVMSGAIISHLAIGDPASGLFGPILLVILTIVSWYFRPVSRKPNFSNNQ
ncbi:DoxX-like protein [Roseivirga pacifica]|uniref:DoxX-like family protein n=1 Tax=Roseivirga pacifica TaxID=1267423 RepID=A0A1I0QVA4_9BACT|nr:DoxX family protein [Roseivirga pacifica]RKQ42497.1 DoxX-like protein [Roseivirga pacifica]SEW31602.1 DoxX-like family protein [Roseivirga pacifica]